MTDWQNRRWPHANNSSASAPRSGGYQNGEAL
nr:MAG TPA: hypothetical protein [Caudoviricetes sp.]